MKVFITYDEGGEIISIGAPEGQFVDSVGVKPTTGHPGHNVIVLDLADVKYPHHFEKYQREFRVHVRSGEPTLCKK
jgi:hypothetical protein